MLVFVTAPVGLGGGFFFFFFFFFFLGFFLEKRFLSQDHTIIVPAQVSTLPGCSPKKVFLLGGELLISQKLRQKTCGVKAHVPGDIQGVLTWRLG
jgi:hypothetical protein